MDTIAAIATAQKASAVGIDRISGDDAAKNSLRALYARVRTVGAAAAPHGLRHRAK